MRKFNIKVNGINYEVEVEEVTETAKAPQLTQAPAPGPELQKRARGSRRRRGRRYGTYTGHRA